MHRSTWFPTSLATAAVFGAALVAVACKDDAATNPISPRNMFVQTDVFADVDEVATTLDKDLLNPWGLAFGPTGILWTSNNHSGSSSLYDTNLAKLPTVAVPGASATTPGEPTGIVFNTTTDFVIPGAGKALFIFAGEDGTIAAWNQSLTTAAKLVANRSANHAVYKGVAIAANGATNLLFLTDFKGGHVDVFDGTFTFVKSFTDQTVPAAFAPFGIANVGGQLFVTFAKQLGPDNEDDSPGAGNGFVDVFNPDGTMVKRFTSNGKLNSPWGIAVAPTTFGAFGGDILIGNFGDGQIGAYDPETGKLVDVLRDRSQKPIIIGGLWGLSFGPGANASKLFFTAGTGGEAHGLLGTLTTP